MDFFHDNSIIINTQKVGKFKYLGFWMSSSSKDFEIRKAQSWQICHQMKTLFKAQ